MVLFFFKEFEFDAGDWAFVDIEVADVFVDVYDCKDMEHAGVEFLAVFGVAYVVAPLAHYLTDSVFPKIFYVGLVVVIDEIFSEGWHAFVLGLVLLLFYKDVLLGFLDVEIVTFFSFHSNFDLSLIMINISSYNS